MGVVTSISIFFSPVTIVYFRPFIEVISSHLQLRASPHRPVGGKRLHLGLGFLAGLPPIQTISYNYNEKGSLFTRVFPKIGVPQNGWFLMENPIKMDDLRVPLFLETPIMPPPQIVFWITPTSTHFTNPEFPKRRFRCFLGCSRWLVYHPAMGGVESPHGVFLMAPQLSSIWHRGACRLPVPPCWGSPRCAIKRTLTSRCSTVIPSTCLSQKRKNATGAYGSWWHGMDKRSMGNNWYQRGFFAWVAVCCEKIRTSWRVVVVCHHFTVNQKHSGTNDGKNSFRSFW